MGWPRRDGPLKMEVKTGEEPPWPRHPVPCLTFDFSRKKKKKPPGKAAAARKALPACSRDGLCSAITSHPVPPPCPAPSPAPPGALNQEWAPREPGPSTTGMMMMSHLRSCHADIDSSAQQSSKDMAKAMGTGRSCRARASMSSFSPWVMPGDKEIPAPKESPSQTRESLGKK